MWSLLLSLFTVARADQFCRALALEGGGSRGAYQVGALTGLVENMPPQELEWNIVTGISTGALNAGGVSLFPMGQEAEMVKFMQDLWLSLNGTGSVYKNWNLLGPAYGIVFKPGMYTTDPLRETLQGVMKHGPLRNVTVGASNLDTGLFGNFNESLGTNILEAVMCSAAPPLYFPPQSFLGASWADGGCILNLDVFSAVERCMDVVSDESLVIVDMIFCSGAHLAPLGKTKDLKVTDVLSRVSAIKDYDNGMWFAYNAMLAYPAVNFRFTIVPSAAMPGGPVPLDFDKQNIVDELALGLKDAQSVIKNGLDPRQEAAQWKQTRYNKATAYSS